MRIPFLQQEGRFRPVIRAALQASNGGFPVSLELQPGGGYGGSIRITLTESLPLEFEADWERTDWTRFPARIRAAATALRDTRQFGTFDVSHQDGTLRIAEV